MLYIYIDKLGQDINGNKNNTGTAQERHGTEMAELLPINKVSKCVLVCRQHNNYLREIVDKVED